MNSAPFKLIFLVAFLLCEAFAAFAWMAPVEPYRMKMMAMGLFFYAASMLL